MHEIEPLIHAIQRQSAEEILVNPRMSKGPGVLHVEAAEQGLDRG